MRDSVRTELRRTAEALAFFALAVGWCLVVAWIRIHFDVATFVSYLLDASTLLVTVGLAALGWYRIRFAFVGAAAVVLVWIGGNLVGTAVTDAALHHRGVTERCTVLSSDEVTTNYPSNTQQWTTKVRCPHGGSFTLAVAADVRVGQAEDVTYDPHGGIGPEFGRVGDGSGKRLVGLCLLGSAVFVATAGRAGEIWLMNGGPRRRKAARS